MFIKEREDLKNYILKINTIYPSFYLYLSVLVWYFVIISAFAYKLFLCQTCVFQTSA